MDGNSPAPRGGPVLDATSISMLLMTILAFFLPLLLYFPPVPPSKRDALLDTHTQVGLRASESGLKKDDASLNAGKSGDAGNDHSGSVRSLWIYPLKSCKGIEVRQSKVLPTGLEFDRLYTFAQLKSAFPVGLQTSSEEKEAQHSWHFITQRQFPLLATVQVDLFIPDIIKARGQPSKVSEPFLLVRFPWQDHGLRGLLSWVAAKIARGWRAVPEKEFVLPVAFPSEREKDARGYALEDVTIWRDTVTALNMEAELPRELALYLGVSNRLGLFRVDPARLRNVLRCAPSRQEAGYQPVAGFQDAVSCYLMHTTFPLHLSPHAVLSAPGNGPNACLAPETTDNHGWRWSR
jgi:hypothetical protein